MTKKLTYEYVKDYFHHQGCKLLEDTYLNVKTKMQYVCNCGACSTITFNAFQQGKRCRSCSGYRKPTLKEVIEYFRINNCELLENTYCNSQTKMKYRCKCGKVSKIRYHDFKVGSRCLDCSGRKKYTYTYVKKHFLDNGCTLLSKQYKNTLSLLKYKCVCDNMAFISFHNFKRGHRCMNCRILNNSGKNHYNWRKDRMEIELTNKIRHRCYKALSRCYKLLGIKKQESTQKLLGYSHKQLKDHMTNHKNWDDIKNLEWHIDHIFPITAFIDYNIYDLKLINALDNLQPLAKNENLCKHNTYDKLAFENWLMVKGYCVACR